LGYFGWFDPPLNALPPITEVQPREGADMAVAVEGSETPSSWNPFNHYAPPLNLAALDGLEARPRRIELFDRGDKPFHYSAGTSAPWLTVSPAEGTVGADQVLSVDVNWAAAPQGTTQATVTIKGDDGRQFTVNVPVVNPRRDGVSGYVETGGVIAIEAEHYAKAVAPQGRQWLKIPGHGRTLSGMSTLPGELPAGALPRVPDMHLDYPIYTFAGGPVHVIATLAPTQKFQPGAGLRFAVSIDDEAPQVVNMHADESLAYWERSVSDGAVSFSTEHRLSGPGAHTLKFWALEPGVVLQKLVVDAGGLKPSYLGPPESPYLAATSR